MPDSTLHCGKYHPLVQQVGGWIFKMTCMAMYMMKNENK